MAALPHPVTVNDMLVKAVYDRLGEQNDLLRQLLDRTTPPAVEKPADGGGTVLVTEPAPPPRAVAKKAAPAKKAVATQPQLRR
jgi:hypothetical protein